MAIEIIENYAKPVSVNPYIADLKGIPVGTVFALTFEIKVNDEGKVRGYKGEVAKVQAAAREYGFTAVTRESVTAEDGKSIRYVFELVPAHKVGGRGRPAKDAAPKPVAPAKRK